MFENTNVSIENFFNMTDEDIVLAHATAIYRMEHALREFGDDSEECTHWNTQVNRTRALVLTVAQHISPTQIDGVLQELYFAVGRYAMSPNAHRKSIVKQTLNYLLG